MNLYVLGKKAGYLEYSVHEDENLKTCYIRYLSVDEKYRTNGYATELLAAFDQTDVAKGKKIILAPINGLRNFYKKRGYENVPDNMFDMYKQLKK